jgi:hypothetical protein
VSDTKELIKRLRSAAWGGLVDVPICDEAADTIARLEAKRSEAVRWKSIHGPRLAAIEALYRDRQLDEGAGREAAATLWSERQANAILTAEVARLEAERDAARREAMEECARMAAQVASDCESWEEGGDFGSSGAYAVEAAIRAAMQGK